MKSLSLDDFLSKCEVDYDEVSGDIVISLGEFISVFNVDEDLRGNIEKASREGRLTLKGLGLEDTACNAYKMRLKENLNAT